MVGKDLSRLLSTPEYEQFCKAELDEPYELLDELRAVAPVHWSPLLGSWVLTSYEEVNRALRSKSLVHERTAINVRGIPGDMLPNYSSLVMHVSNWLGFTDPPKHTRLRELSRHLINPALATRLSPWMTGFVRNLLIEMQATEEVDLLETLALRLPLAVMCEALGIAYAEATQLHALSADVGSFAGRVDPSWGSEAQASLERSNQSWFALEDLFQGLIAEKRRRPGDDVLTALVRARDEGTLSEDELIGLSVFFFAAGHDTSRDLLANSLYLLLTHRSELHRVCHDRALVGPAVEEVLRFESPIPMVSQLAASDQQIGGEMVRAGDAVILHLGAANRDPARFEDPARLDVTRADNRHVAFGFGAHLCLGAPLARHEAAVVLEELAPHLERLELTSPLAHWGQGDMSGRKLLELKASWALPVAAPS